MEPAVILLGSLFIFIILRVPIAFSLAFSSILTIMKLGLPLSIVGQKMTEGVKSFALLAIPFFILAGEIMSQGGLTKRILNFSNAIVGHIRGGLAMVNIVASMFFGGVSGSSVADTSAIGSMLIPIMTKRGYDKDFAVNVTVTSSQQGIVIPPSHNAIIYSLAAGGLVSIQELFMAGIIPGISIGLALMIVSYIIAVKRNYPREENFSIKKLLASSWEAGLGLLTFVIIIGGITSGIFTATEASAIAVTYALFISLFVYKEIKFKDLYGIFLNAVKTITIVLFLIATAKVFGWLLAYLRIPDMVTLAITNISTSPVIILLMINLLLLVLGCIMDMAPLIIIVTPILLPVILKLGMSPVQFGIVMMLNLGIGLCTPPVGSTLFVGCTIGKISIEETVKGIWPFYIAMIVVLMLATFIPDFSLFIPKMLFGN